MRSVEDVRSQLVECGIAQFEYAAEQVECIRSATRGSIKNRLLMAAMLLEEIPFAELALPAMLSALRQRKRAKAHEANLCFVLICERGDEPNFFCDYVGPLTERQHNCFMDEDYRQDNWFHSVQSEQRPDVDEITAEFDLDILPFNAA